MNNAAVDITHCRVVAPYLDPDEPDPELAREAAEAANEDYIDAWCSGDLYDDGETYSQPIQAMAESHPGLWTQLLETYRHGDHAELESIAGTLARALNEHVKAQGEGV